MRYFIDTEFIERGPDYPIELISIAVVADTDNYLYAILNERAFIEFQGKIRDGWCRDLTTPRFERSVLAQSIKDFIAPDPNPEFWGYFADYDWVVLCQLFGAMDDLPKGWPMYCNDIMQLAHMLGFRDEHLPKQVVCIHNALADALHIKLKHEWLCDQLATLVLPDGTRKPCNPHRR